MKFALEGPTQKTLVAYKDQKGVSPIQYNPPTLAPPKLLHAGDLLFYPISRHEVKWHSQQ